PTPGAAPAAGAEELVRSIHLALEQARRTRRHVTLVALDSGGIPGDGAVETLAELVRNTVRSGDGLWRDGNTGLALLLADVDGLGVEPVLARMRLRLRSVTPRVRMGRAAAAPGIGAADLLELARGDRDARGR
ncbi:MAG TPA: hypothetical protein VNT51_13795, partial [Miltoncostaeaceae bacterium]|nr:hypothetical protein [Miltoncostaeaceae bacterium]